MKEKIVIKRFDTVLYSGNILDIPIKEQAIIEKSIELFGDEDPCVVHMSFVVKELVNDLLSLFTENNCSSLKVADHLPMLSFINFEKLFEITIKLVRDKS